jgi:hypothetical protein
MAFLRGLILLLLVGAAGAFAAFAWTGQARFKRYGLRILAGTLLGAVLFFAVLMVDRIN